MVKPKDPRLSTVKEEIQWNPNDKVWQPPKDPNWAQENKEANNDWACENEGTDWDAPEMANTSYYEEKESKYPAWLPDGNPNGMIHKCREIMEDTHKFPDVRHLLMPKIPIIKKGMTKPTIRHRYNIYRNIYNKLNEVFPVAKNKISYQRAYHELVMMVGECNFGMKHYASETYCHGCRTREVELEQLWEQHTR
jgi:hypothetical protein